MRTLPHLAQSEQAPAYRSAFGPTSGAPIVARVPSRQKRKACSARRFAKSRCEAIMRSMPLPRKRLLRLFCGSVKSQVTDLNPAAAFSWGL